MKPLGDGFIKLIKMIIAPIIFCTVVVGIAGMEDMKKVGKTGGYALLYFEIVSTIALIVGLTIINIVQPGAGMNIDPATLDTKGIAAYAQARQDAEHDRFPAQRHSEHRGRRIREGRDPAGAAVRRAVRFRAAQVRRPRHARVRLDRKDLARAVRDRRLHHEGRADRRVRRDGVHDRQVRRGLARVARQADGHVLRSPASSSSSSCSGSSRATHGFSICKFIRYIKEELLIVLGTSSSESVLPRMMAKMENLGVKKSTVGLVIPTGYSFNLDGTSIYLTMAAVFIAQATNTPMTLTQQLTLLAVLLLTSKGAAGVTGSGFIVLAATLSAVGHVPVAGLALILGIDRFMSEARALTNLIGNGVATVVVGKWCGELDEARMKRVLDKETDVEAEEPERVLDRDGNAHARSRKLADRGKQRWRVSRSASAMADHRRADSAHRIVIVGGGAGGLELATRSATRWASATRPTITLIDKRAHARLEAEAARDRGGQHGPERPRDRLPRAVALAPLPLPDRRDDRARPRTARGARRAVRRRRGRRR